MSVRISHTEATTLALCERKWWFKYLEKPPLERSEKAYLGTIMHKMVAAWWDAPSADDGYEAAIGVFGGFLNAEVNRESGAENDSLEWFQKQMKLVSDNEPFVTASWLMARYHEHYGPSHHELKVIGSELYAEVPIPGTQIVVALYIDQLVVDEQLRLWVIERKTMTDFSRLGILQADPQTTTYVWACRAIGIPVVGLWYDAIRTYRWKRDAHPAVDSFEGTWLPRSDEQVAEGVEELKTAAARKGPLAAGSRPLRNVGEHCRRCDYQGPCFELLQLGEPQIEVVT